MFAVGAKRIAGKGGRYGEGDEEVNDDHRTSRKGVVFAEPFMGVRT